MHVANASVASSCDRRHSQSGGCRQSEQPTFIGHRSASQTADLEDQRSRSAARCSHHRSSSCRARTVVATPGRRAGPGPEARPVAGAGQSPGSIAGPGSRPGPGSGPTAVRRSVAGFQERERQRERQRQQRMRTRNSNELENKVDNEVDNSLDNKVDNEVDNNIENKIENTIDNEVRRRCRREGRSRPERRRPEQPGHRPRPVPQPTVRSSCRTSSTRRWATATSSISTRSTTWSITISTSRSPTTLAAPAEQWCEPGASFNMEAKIEGGESKIERRRHRRACKRGFQRGCNHQPVRVRPEHHAGCEHPVQQPGLFSAAGDLSER